MASIIPGFEYDIFISYRHNDNRSGWVTEFANTLQAELASTIKESVSVYFDTNPHDGLLETHHVDKSLEGKLKCLIFIPIISQTYCDSKSFAWQHEFCAFNELALNSPYGRDIKLSNGNVASRILPIKIHDLDLDDKTTIENELGGILRPIEFIYRETGVNRPLKLSDSRNDNQNRTDYGNQINKVANAIKELIFGLKNFGDHSKILTGKKKLNRQEEVNSQRSGNNVSGKSNFGPRYGYKVALILFVSVIIGSIVYFRSTQKSGEGSFKTSSEGSTIEKSIAVLPFVNLSGDPKQEYFGDGIAEEILNSLTQLENIKVAARTSSFAFKGRQVDLREIGNKLNVANILEGSVRKSGEHIRITAQLISIKDGYHIWSQEYNSRLDDVLKVQEEIAIIITEKLKVSLLRNEKIELEKKRTESTEAYDLYLKGNYFWNQRNLQASEKYFQEAVQLDSNFAHGYEGLAKTYVLYQFFGLSSNLSMAKVDKAAKRAIALDSSLAEPYLCLAMKNSIFDWNPVQAKVYFKKALALNPKYPTSHYWYGQFLILYGGKNAKQEVISEMRKGYDLDPDNQSSPHNLGLAFMHQEHYTEAIKEIKRSMELKPEFALPPFNLALCYYALGDLEESKKAFERADRLLNDQGTAYLPFFYLKEGKKDQAKAILNRLTELAKIKYVHELSFAIAASFLGEKDLAHGYFVEAVTNHDTWLPYYLKYPGSMTKNLLSDPRNKLALPEVLRNISNQ